MEQYRLTELRDYLEKQMECPVCLERLSSPVCCCYNGHPLCGKCSKDIGSRCPLCKTIFLTGQNTFINQLISLFPFKCRFSVEGCEERGSPESLYSHEKSCEYRYVSCPFLTQNRTACTALVTVRSYPAHIEEHHPSYITGFDVHRWVYTGVLPKIILQDRLNCYYTVIKDGWKKLYFVAMIYYHKTTRTYQISVHHLGKDSEASKYIFTIKMRVEGVFERLIYSNKCLPNMMTPEEAQKHDPFEVKDTNGRISNHKDEVSFFLDIRNAEGFLVYSNQGVEQAKKRKKLEEVVVSSHDHNVELKVKEANNGVNESYRERL